MTHRHSPAFVGFQLPDQQSSEGEYPPGPPRPTGLPGRRIFVSEGGVERRQIPEAAAPARPGHSDSQATWER